MRTGHFVAGDKHDVASIQPSKLTKIDPIQHIILSYDIKNINIKRKLKETLSQ